MTNKTLDLMRKYSVDIADMCKGTKLEGKEWECVRVKEYAEDKFWQKLDFLTNIFKYEVHDFCVSVLEDKPVFVGDEVYRKDNGRKHDWVNYSWANDWSKWTWNKPTPKRTFDLNGVELPCPVNQHAEPIITIQTEVLTRMYRFKTQRDADEVVIALGDILDQAEDK